MQYAVANSSLWAADLYGAAHFFGSPSKQSLAAASTRSLRVHYAPMTDSLTLLGGRNPETFLAEFWQKQPLLIRGAFPGFSSPITPDELAGLSCEADVESRLVLEKAGPTPWSVEYGPMAEDRFADLPETHWTLLVQECNRYVPELAELLEHFNFIPRWRVDDVMASYAPAQGSVGPHSFCPVLRL